jgi:hypothetical protein
MVAVLVIVVCSRWSKKSCYQNDQNRYQQIVFHDCTSVSIFSFVRLGQPASAADSNCCGANDVNPRFGGILVYPNGDVWSAQLRLVGKQAAQNFVWEWMVPRD